MPDIDDVYGQISAAVGVIDAATSAHVPIERHDHVILAMAAVSRCQSFLLGAVELDRAGRSDIVGVLVRSLVEAFYFGVIALLGERTDLDRLEEDHRYWKNDLAKQFPDVMPDEGPTSKFSVYQRAKRADELLTGIGQQPGVAVESYKVFYAGESLSGAHASFETMNRYVFNDDAGTIGIVREPDDDPLRYGRLRVAVALTALLAKWTWEWAGLDGDAFDDIEGLSDSS